MDIELFMTVILAVAVAPFVYMLFVMLLSLVAVTCCAVWDFLRGEK